MSHDSADLLRKSQVTAFTFNYIQIFSCYHDNLWTEISGPISLKNHRYIWNQNSITVIFCLNFESFINPLPVSIFFDEKTSLLDLFSVRHCCGLLLNPKLNDESPCYGSFSLKNYKYHFFYGGSLGNGF